MRRLTLINSSHPSFEFGEFEVEFARTHTQIFIYDITKIFIYDIDTLHYMIYGYGKSM